MTVTTSFQTSTPYVINASGAFIRVAAHIGQLIEGARAVDRSKCAILNCRDCPVASWPAVVSTALASCTS
jgi:hypothetical protein